MIKSKIEDKSQSSILKGEEKKEQDHSQREKNNKENNDSKAAKKKKIKNTKGDRGCGIGRSTRKGRRRRGKSTAHIGSAGRLWSRKGVTSKGSKIALLCSKSAPVGSTAMRAWVPTKSIGKDKQLTQL